MVIHAALSMYPMLYCLSTDSNTTALGWPRIPVSSASGFLRTDKDLVEPVEVSADADDKELFKSGPEKLSEQGTNS